MTLARGFRFGAYEVLSLLGVGGMGEVYRARDTKLNRDVALKILPDVFALDPDRCARFEREAQILASLSHPGIGAIYGLEDSAVPEGGTGASPRKRALVLELIEGPTLADELARGALPVTQALEIAGQIAEALEAAHESAIVHRDLKPANIKVRPDGLVKVLDFGLAKALESPAARPASSQPKTLMSPALTEVGTLFGTAAYMSPEQARGRAADKRSDVWAFGCVLFEMLTGKRAFAGEETSDVIAAILRGEPEWSALPTDVPPSIHRLLRRCLEKDRARRLRDIGDARLEIDDGRLAPATAHAGARSSVLRERIAWTAALALAALAAFGATRWSSKVERPAETRLDITTAETTVPASFAISPDGGAVVYNVEGARGSQLWIRSLESTSARPLAGTEGGQYPFWSPDGRSIGFFTVNLLKRVDIDGGRPQTLATVVTAAGGTWNADGTILYVPLDNGGVFRIPATGGESQRVIGREQAVDGRAPIRTPALATRHPQFLPDGRHFLFYVALEDESAGVYVGDLGSDGIRRILGTDTPAVYGAGHLWFVNGDSLFAQQFDPTTQELTGSVVRVADDVSVDATVAAISASAVGPIAYRTGARWLRRQLSWFDRTGRPLGIVGDDDLRVTNPSLSPDGRQLLVQQTVRQNVDVWLLDIDRGILTRQTVDPAVESMPVWAPDGGRFVFNAPGENRRELAIKHIDGSKPDEVLDTFSDDIAISTDWSADGQYVLIKRLDPSAGTWDLWALPAQGGSMPLPLASTAYDEKDGQFSPDGQSFAFESNESGTAEIYVQPFPQPGAKVRISTNGGEQVRWRRDGKELYYVALDGMLMAVPVDASAGRSGFGTPVPLFETRLTPTVAIGRQQYVVTNDGERFLMVTAEEAPAPPITLLLNWQPPVPR